MSRCTLAVILGLGLLGGSVWWLQGPLASQGWVQWTGAEWQIVATGWTLLRLPFLWLVVLLGGVGGWLVGRLDGRWTAARAAAALQTARQALEQDIDVHAYEVRDERRRLDQAWAMLRAAQEQIDQTRHEAEGAAQRWQAWAKTQVAQARAQAEEAERRRRNATATAERRARQLARFRTQASVRSHPAS